MLIKEGVSVNAKDYNGDTALKKAPKRATLRLWKCCLRLADVNVACRWGFRALHWAAENGHVATVEVLLKAGADRNVKNDEGETPAMLAEKKEKQDVEATT